MQEITVHGNYRWNDGTGHSTAKLFPSGRGTHFFNGLLIVINIANYEKMPIYSIIHAYYLGNYSCPLFF